MACRIIGGKLAMGGENRKLIILFEPIRIYKEPLSSLTKHSRKRQRLGNKTKLKQCFGNGGRDFLSSLNCLSLKRDDYFSDDNVIFCSRII